jgi:hypothetical protein
MVNQLRAYNEYSKKHLGIYFYGIAGGNEVDLIIETKKRSTNSAAEIIAVEFKLGTRWKNDWKQGLSSLTPNKKFSTKKKYVVYTGTSKFESEDILVLGAGEFLELLFKGDIF